MRYIKDNKQFYNLDKIEQSSGDPYHINLTTTHTNLPGTLNFKACHVPTSLPANCPKGFNEIGYIIGKDSTGADRCWVLSQNNDNDADTDWSFSGISQSTKRTSDQLQMVAVKTFKRILEGAHVHHKLTSSPDGIRSSGTNIGKNGIIFNVDFSMKCDKASKTISNLTASYDSSLRTYFISFKHKNACGYDLFGFWDQIGNWKYVVGSVIAIICLGITFAGNYLFKPTFAIIGFLAGSALTYVVLN